MHRTEELEDTQIGSFTLKAPKGTFYNRPLPTLYDYGPWIFIASLLRERHKCHLVDIGGNIGDSVAWWKTLIGGSAISIEPSPRFFELLVANTSQFDHVQCLQALVTGHDRDNKVIFSSGSSTGQTRLAGPHEGPHTGSSSVYSGPTVTTTELLDRSPEDIVFKTDTDGFDDEIVLSLAQDLRLRPKRQQVLAIFMEGPSQTQILDGDYGGFLQALKELVELGYHCAVFANAGSLLCSGISSCEQIHSIVHGLEMSFLNRHAYCHYVDFVFYDPSLQPLQEWALGLNRGIRTQSFNKALTLAQSRPAVPAPQALLGRSQ